MRITLARRFDFRGDAGSVGRDLVTPEGWDAARANVGGFQLPSTRAEWERLADAPELVARARAVAAVAERVGARTLCSHGVGAGALELAIQQAAPGLALTCTDYAPRATERLRQLFPEARVLLHDLAEDAPPDADLHLMYRVDTELDAETWQRVLARYERPVLFVPALLLGLERLAKELARLVVARGGTRAGWLRSRDALVDLWRRTHAHQELEVGDMTAFLLERRAPSP
jgi:hypothetical protein